MRPKTIILYAERYPRTTTLWLQYDDEDDDNNDDDNNDDANNYDANDDDAEEGRKW